MTNTHIQASRYMFLYIASKAIPILVVLFVHAFLVISLFLLSLFTMSGQNLYDVLCVCVYCIACIAELSLGISIGIILSQKNSQPVCSVYLFLFFVSCRCYYCIAGVTQVFTPFHITTTNNE
jgi:hypothetical protein